MVNYPNGRSRVYSAVPKKKKSLTEVSVNKNSSSKPKGIVAFGKRGMNFESEINATNDYYLSHGLAVIHKEVEQKLQRPTSDKPQLLTILGFIKAAILTLKQKKHNKKRFFL
jgi:hypothetical protein